MSSFLHTTVTFVCVLIIAVSLKFVYFNKDPVAELLAEGSSVHCLGQNHIQRRCYFDNLCYHQNLSKYLFIHGLKTSVSGFEPEQRFNPALVDLSSVEDHNAQYFSYIDVPRTFFTQNDYEKVTYIPQTVLIFNRFNPGNLMHVFHDDLLPLYFTLTAECRGNLSRCHDLPMLFINDEEPRTEYNFLYEILSDSNVMFRTELPNDSLICFKKAIVGLEKRSTWYQYGFRVPQGPSVKANAITGPEIRGFCSYIESKLKISHVDDQYAVLLTRTYNRRILNINELVQTIEEVAKIPVRILTMEGDLKNAIETVKGASMLISTHGSALILSMFLKPGSIVIELFPFGINAENYTPYKTLAKINNIGYYAWQNKFENNTVTHPDWPREFGGLTHLTTLEQNKILQSSQVPPHLCCTDPYWLFRIYQDTYVNLDSFSSIIQSAIAVENSKKNHYKDKTTLFCSEIDKIDCGTVIKDDGIYICANWTKPVNVIYINNDNGDVVYDILTREFNGEKVEAYFVKKQNVCFGPFEGIKSIYVWIRCVIDNVPGPYNANAKLCSGSKKEKI